MIPIAIVGGRIADRYGHRSLLVVGGVVFALGSSLLYQYATLEPVFLQLWLPVSLIAGVGVGLLLPILSSAAVNGLPAERFGVGSAVNQAVRQFGSVVGVALVISLLAADVQAPLVLFDEVFLVLIGGGLLTSLISLGIMRV